MQFTREYHWTADGQVITRRFAKDPAVARLGDTYFLYFSAFADENPNQLRIGIATSGDGESWQFAGLLPLEGACEERGIGAPCAFRQDGTVHLFYQTYGNREKDAICHAFSTDGVHFTRDPSNPVFSPSTDWCCGRAIDADVVAFGDKLYLYFATRDAAFAVQQVGVAAADLHSGFSRADWKQCLHAPCLAPVLPWEKNCIEAPAALAHDGKVYLFYGGAYNCEPQQIGVAVSDDAVHFTRLSDSPFLPNGAPGTWNASESGHPYVFADDSAADANGEVYLYYQGSPDGGNTWLLSRRRLSFRNGRPELV